MNTTTTEDLIHEAFHGSSEGRLHFGQVIGLMQQAGVESYVADYRTHQTTYYLPTGQVVAITLDMPDTPIANSFNPDAVKAAIRGAQQGLVKYQEFKHLTCAAGCIGYTVWIAGRHVTYFGRKGEMHVEHFPN